MAPLASLLNPHLGTQAITTIFDHNLPYQLPPSISTNTHHTASQLIRHILDFTPTLTYFDLIANPFIDNSHLTCYADPLGNTYWLDHDRRLVIKMDPDSRPFAPTRSIAKTDHRPIAELRTMAQQIARCSLPNFQQQIHRFHPFEQRLGRDHIIFRWEATAALNNDHIPNLYIDLWMDGLPRAYANTLSYWPKIIPT